MNHAGHGKIARLPHRLREELNQRLLDGALGPQVLPWLNGLPEMRAVLDAHFGGEEVSAKNLSDYRQGAYAQWLSRRDQLSRQQTLSAHALEVVKASGLNLSSAATALAAGRLYEAIETITDEGAPPAEILEAVNAIRTLDIQEKKLALKEREVESKGREVTLKELSFYMATAKKVAELAQSAEVQRIASGPGTEEDRMRQLAGLIFGEDLIAEREQRAKAARGE